MACTFEIGEIVTVFDDDDQDSVANVGVIIAIAARNRFWIAVDGERAYCRPKEELAHFDKSTYLA